MPGAPAPVLITQGFGSQAAPGTITTPIPNVSQIPTAPGRASYPTGFVPLNGIPVTAGGINPFEQDFNGILYDISSNIAAQTGGQLYQFSAAYAAANSGYALGAVLQQAANPYGLWVNLLAGNTTNPDTGGSNWAPTQIFVNTTAAEAAAGVTPVNYQYPQGDIRRYGPVLDGVTDDTAPLTNWAKCGGSLTWPVPLTARTSAAVPVPSNTSIYAVDGACIKGGADQSLLTGNNSIQVTVRGLSFTQAACGSNPYVAGIALSGSSAWLVDDCEFFGLQWAGVWCENSPRNTIRGCQFHDWSGPTAATFTGTVAGNALTVSGVSGSIAIGQIVANATTGVVIGPIISGSGTSWVLGNTPGGSISGVSMKTYTPVADSADVVLYDSSSDNMIINNPMMKSWAHHGVLCQDPYTVPSNPPRNNLIAGNDISDHIDYGVAVYIPSVTASFTGSVSGTALTVSGTVTGTIAIGQFLVNGTSGVVYGQILSGSGTSWVISTSAGTVTSQLLYAATPQDTDNRVNNNKISNIQGCGTNTSAGTGIYIVGAGAGGTQANSNRLKNCCISTQDASLAPGAIGIAGQNFAGLGITPVQANDNQISGMSQGDGIRVVGCGNGAQVNDNNVNIPASNAGSGRGGSALIGHCVNILASGLVDAIGNKGQNYGSGSGYNISVGGVACTDINIIGGRMETAAGVTLAAAGTSSFALSNVQINGFRGRNNGTTNGIALTWVAGGCVNGSTMACVGPSSNGGVALALSNSTVVQAAAGAMRSNGSTDISLSGTCTNSFIDKSVNNSGVGHISNTSTGGNIDTFGTAVPPGSGAFAQGDHVWIQAPVHSGTKYGSCYTGGSPGSWDAST